MIEVDLNLLAASSLVVGHGHSIKDAMKAMRENAPLEATDDEIVRMTEELGFVSQPEIIGELFEQCLRWKGVSDMEMMHNSLRSIIEGKERDGEEMPPHMAKARVIHNMIDEFLEAIPIEHDGVRQYMPRPKLSLAKTWDTKEATFIEVPAGVMLCVCRCHGVEGEEYTYPVRQALLTKNALYGLSKAFDIPIHNEDDTRRMSRNIFKHLKNINTDGMHFKAVAYRDPERN